MDGTPCEPGQRDICVDGVCRVSYAPSQLAGGLFWVVTSSSSRTKWLSGAWWLLTSLAPRMLHSHHGCSLTTSTLPLRTLTLLNKLSGCLGSLCPVSLGSPFSEERRDQPSGLPKPTFKEFHPKKRGREWLAGARTGLSRSSALLSGLRHLVWCPCLSLPSPSPSPQVVGCDHKLDSTKQEDKCLQCGGDGSSCYPITGTFDANDLSRGGVAQGSLQGSVARPPWLACHHL